MKQKIINGRVLDPAQNIDKICDIYIQDGRVESIGKPSGSPDSYETFDADGLWVTPGLIDIHVHLREPGREDKETIHSGSESAVAGGFTSIACMANTQPVNDNQAVTRFILEKAATEKARVYPIAAITRGLQSEELTEMADLIRAGAIAFSDDGFSVRNPELLRRAFEYSCMFGKPIIEHCEDPDLSAGGVMHEGFTSTRLGLPGIPSLAEELIVQRDIQIAEFTGGRLHIAHVSTEKSVEIIRQAKARGISVTAEATPHHLVLHDELLVHFDTNFKMNPPLRPESDRKALVAGLIDGTIDCIATDHAPHRIQEKYVEFNVAPNGVIGLETALSVIMTRLVHTQVITPLRMVELMSSGPAKVLDLPGGTLKPGSPADITILDPEYFWTVNPQEFKSKSQNTPFSGWNLRGGVVRTIIQGNVVFDIHQDGKV